MRFKSSLFLAISLVSTFATTRADAIVSILNFQAGGLYAFQNGGGDTLTGQVSWTPYFNVGVIGLRGELGVTLLRDGFDDTFLATNLEARVDLSLTPGISIELGGGAHNWTDGNGGTNPALTGLVVVHLPGGIDRIYAGYSRVFVPNANTNELRAGIGFSF